MDRTNTPEVRRASALLAATRNSAADARGVARRRCAPPCALAACLASLACQSYAPRPLEPEVHRAAWRERVPDVERVRDFASRLDVLPAGASRELDLADGLDEREARLVALVHNPELRVARMIERGAAAGASEAGRAEDPALALDALRITEDVPDPWVISAGLTLTLPLGERREAAKDLARAELAVATAATREAEWRVLLALERAWIEWSALRVRADETETIAGALDELADALAVLADRGEVRRTEAALVRIAAAQRRSRLVGLRGDVDAAALRVRGVLGLAPEVDLELVPSLARDTGERTMRADDDPLAANLALARLRAEYDAAEARLRLEVERQAPDLSLGPLFESDEGQTRVGLLGGLPLPFWNANRRAIAEARAAREVARARCEAEYERSMLELAVLDARRTAQSLRRDELARTVVPLVDRQLVDALELARLGEEGALLVLETLSRALDVRLELIEVRAAALVLDAEAEFLLGPPTTPSPAAAADSEEKDR